MGHKNLEHLKHFYCEKLRQKEKMGNYYLFISHQKRSLFLCVALYRLNLLINASFLNQRL